jgi:uncharacterized membrane protein YjjP (DUF1212 family)
MKESDLYLLLISFVMGLIIGVLGFYIDPIKNIIDLTFVLLVFGCLALISFIGYFKLRSLGK